MNKKEIFEKADAFLKENEVNSYPVDIIGLCETAGITVFEDDLPERVSGFIVIQDKPLEPYGKEKLIVVNENELATRQRFTIAHELAHYILHKEKNQELYAHRDAGQYGGIETEANTFASAILMPEKLVKEVIQSGPKFVDPVLLLCQKFLVSQEAARVRLDQLRLKR